MAVVTLTSKIFVGDVGTAFRGTFKENGVVVNISAATTKNMIFEKPDGTIVTKSAVFLTDGSDGILQYVSISGDLNIGGNWRLQGYVDLGSWAGHSDLVNFKIFDHLT